MQTYQTRTNLPNQKHSPFVSEASRVKTNRDYWCSNYFFICPDATKFKEAFEEAKKYVQEVQIRDELSNDISKLDIKEENEDEESGQSKTNEETNEDKSDESKNTNDKTKDSDEKADQKWIHFLRIKQMIDSTNEWINALNKCIKFIISKKVTKIL